MLDTPVRPARARLLVPSIALCCGVTVATIYLGQPVLTLIAADLGVTTSAAGLVATLGQAGYALGLLLLVPLGDVLPRRPLLLALIAGTVAALVAAALAPGLPVLLVAVFAASALTVVPQLLVPLAATLVPPHRRAHTVAVLQAGLLAGIVAARTVGGLLGAHAGWRSVYLVAAATTALAGVATAVQLAPGRPGERLGYHRLLASLPRLLREEPVLRTAGLLQALSFGTFSLFWSTLVYLFSGAPYRFDAGTAGLFGLVGLVGLGSAQVVGRLTHRYGPMPVVGAATAGLAAATALFGLARHGIGYPIAAIALLTVAMQAGQVANQSRIMTVRPGAAMRLNTVFMVCSFAGGTPVRRSAAPCSPGTAGAGWSSPAVWRRSRCCSAGSR